jgi:hypothetical protein
MRMLVVAMLCSLVACTPKSRPYAAGAGIASALVGGVMMGTATSCGKSADGFEEGVGCAFEATLKWYGGGALIGVGAALLIAAAVSPGEPSPAVNPAATTTTHGPAVSSTPLRPRRGEALRLGFR